MGRRSKKTTALLAFLVSATVALLGHEAAGRKDPELRPDAIRYISRIINEYPIVCLGEGVHQAQNPHALIKTLLSDGEVLNALDVVIVEFATSRYQAVLDDFIMGRDVPYAELCRAWRDTSTSPITPWNSPLYYELLQLIRANNRSLTPDKQLRVLGGDPPIEWEQIKNREEFQNAPKQRNAYVSNLAIEQAFKLNKKVLIIYGGAHLPKVPVGSQDEIRDSITYRIELEYPGSVRAIEFLRPDDLRIEDRIPELEEGTIYETGDHWIGQINAELLFPETYTVVTDEKMGERRWEKGVLYKGVVVKDIFDALIYIGPSSDWLIVRDAPDPYQDDEYWAELNRRSMIRFNRPMDISLRKPPAPGP